MLERKHQPVLPRSAWMARVLRFTGLAGSVIGATLLLGVTGYHFIGQLSWVDALLEASMILGGMGAVAPMHTDAIKLFASFYALLSGLVIVSSTGILITPWIHRLLHSFHDETKAPTLH